MVQEAVSVDLSARMGDCKPNPPSSTPSSDDIADSDFKTREARGHKSKYSKDTNMGVPKYEDGPPADDSSGSKK